MKKQSHGHMNNNYAVYKCRKCKKQSPTWQRKPKKCSWCGESKLTRVQ